VNSDISFTAVFKLINHSLPPINRQGINRLSINRQGIVFPPLESASRLNPTKILYGSTAVDPYNGR